MPETQKKQAPPAEPAEKPAEPPAELFPVKRLIAEGRAFIGYPPHVVAGALSGSGKDEMTKEEAARRVERWLASPVKVKP